MANRSVSIAAKLIIANTILLVLVTGLFGALTKLQGRRVVENTIEQTKQLRDHVRRALAAVEHSRLQGRDALLANLKAVDAALASESPDKVRELGSGLTSVVLAGALVLLLGIALNVVQSMRISAPIRALERQAARIASGDLNARVEVTSQDEIGALARRFNSMAAEVSALVQDRMLRAVLEKELEVASAVQASLIPDSDAMDLHGMSVAGCFKPSTQCGGDWWDSADLADGRAFVIVGDATGHGAAAAMVTAAAKGATTALKDHDCSAFQVASLLKAMNAAIHDVAKGRFVMTCFASIYDPATRTLEYANAGHPFPYLLQGGQLRPLIARGNRLGEVTRSVFETGKATLEPGSTIVWYSDGIIDGESPQGEKYGERRFRQQIEQHAKLGATELRDAMLAHAFEFFGDAPQKDDIVLIVGKVG